MTLAGEPGDAAGTVVAGRYTIVRTLGHGAFGRTFLARDGTTGADVAVKLLDPHGTADWKARELFEREATVLRALRHHGIPQVHDLVRDRWQEGPADFLVMEYIAGTSLARLIDERRPLDPAQVMHLALELLGILDYLHGRVPAVLHRDIKPANVIVRPDGSPALVDFGSVRHLFLGADEVGSTIAGTYGYMPYEQYMGQASPRSDLYALGATFLHLLTGRAPRDFMGDEGRIAVPAHLPGDARLGPVVARLLRPNPAERFGTAREVRDALLAPAGAPAALAPLIDRSLAMAVLETPAPRPFDADARALFDKVAPGSLDYLDTSARPTDRAGILDWGMLALVTVATAGIYPFVFIGMARARRRRLRLFFERGLPAAATVTRIAPEKVAFASEMVRVSYEFMADGSPRRDADLVLPAIGNRLREGDTIRVMYVADPDYDSVIVGP